MLAFWMFLKEDSSVHQDCIYLIENKVKYFYNWKELLSIVIYFQMWFISVIKAEFSAS